MPSEGARHGRAAHSNVTAAISRASAAAAVHACASCPPAVAVACACATVFHALSAASRSQGPPPPRAPTRQWPRRRPPATRCPSCCDPPPLLTSGRACAQPLRRSSASALCCLLRHLGLGPVKRRGRVRNLRCRALPHGDRAPRIGAARNGSPLVPVVGGWQHLTRLRDLGV